MACPGRECVQDEEPKCQSMTGYNQFCFILQDQGIFMDNIIYEESTLNCKAWDDGSFQYLRGNRIRNSKPFLAIQPNVAAGN